MLDHYRLKVPKIRAFLEYVNFVILFILYVVAIERLDPQHVNGYELVFIVYALAFSLDKAAAIREHGLKGMWDVKAGADGSLLELPRQWL